MPDPTPATAAALSSNSEPARQYYPIVYVRGYAMTAGEREEVFNDGYYGFAMTSVEKRQAPPPHYFEADIFEGLLIRLMKDHDYVDAFNRGLKGTKVDPTRSLWVFRFYDPDYFSQKIRSIEEHADDLRKLICEQIPARLKECKVSPPDDKVILIAHSMGGLVCRTLIQKVLPAAKIDPKRVIHRLVTLGTPHRGIDLGAIPDFLEDRVVNALNPFDSGIFKEGRMREYLGLEETTKGGPKKKKKDNNYVYDVHSLGPADRFPVKRCLCVIGSDWQSYSNVRRLTGGISDGLVKQDRAYIVSGPRPPGDDPYEDEHRAFWANVHRAHSGYRGIVNSYESYENIQRFLFGDTMLSLALENIEIRTNREAGSRYFYDLGFALSVRGTNAFLHRREQTPCENAIRIALDTPGAKPRESVFLHTGFMNSSLRQTEEPYSHFLLRFSVTEHRVKDGLLWDQEYPGRSIYAEEMEVRVGADVEFRWLSEVDHAANGGWAKASQKDGTFRFPLRDAKSFASELVVKYSKWPSNELTLDD